MMNFVLKLIVKNNLSFTENVESAEAKGLFEANFSHIYNILYESFVQTETNLRQRGRLIMDLFKICQSLSLLILMSGTGSFYKFYLYI